MNDKVSTIVFVALVALITFFVYYVVYCFKNKKKMPKIDANTETKPVLRRSLRIANQTAKNEKLEEETVPVKRPRLAVKRCFFLSSSSNRNAAKWKPSSTPVIKQELLCEEVMSPPFIPPLQNWDSDEGYDDNEKTKKEPTTPQNDDNKDSYKENRPPLVNNR